MHYNYSGDEEDNDRSKYTESENKRANFLDKMAHKFKWAERYEYDTDKEVPLCFNYDSADSDHTVMMRRLIRVTLSDYAGTFFVLMFIKCYKHNANKL